MREGLKPDRYNLRMPAPEPIVPRARRVGVRERIRADGRVAIPLDRRSLDRAIRQLKTAGVEAVAVCYLHSYRDPRHEVATRKALARALPGVYVSLSSEVFPQIKEYERVCTTVVNAYVGPALDRYLSRLARRLKTAGYAGPLLIMQSHGGVVPVAESVRMAAGAVLSGPAGGVAGGVFCSALMKEGNFIPFDMGGTSTDISLIVDGQPALATDRAVAGEKIALRSLDIVSLGAGGGSIGWVDPSGILRVGPESAGAEPGPACYGKGGTEPTVTDANLVLGYLDPDNFLGGRTRLDRGRGRTRGRRARGKARRRPHVGGRGRPPGREHAHGRGDPPGVGAARRRPAAVRAARLRRRGGPARHRRRPPARARPRHRAPRGRRALGVGHARDRPALRGRAHPHRRRPEGGRGHA